MNRFYCVALISTALQVSAVEPEIEKFCHRVASGSVAEIQGSYSEPLSQRDLDLARRSAIISCINVQEIHLGEGQKPIPVSVTQQNRHRTVTKTEKKEQSIFERLLESPNKKRQDLPLIRQRQQTGGK